jgi:hypothetical protein
MSKTDPEPPKRRIRYREYYHANQDKKIWPTGKRIYRQQTNKETDKYLATHQWIDVYGESSNEYLYSHALKSKLMKYPCIGGPFDKTLQTLELGRKNDYLAYNQSHRSKETKVIQVHKSLIKEVNK